MPIELITKNHGIELSTMFSSAVNNISVISPFMGKRTCEQLSERINKKRISCRVITRFYREDFIQNVSSIEGLKLLLEAGADIKALISLHTKLYIVDDIFSVVTSANYTFGGLQTNHELGIKIDNEPEINHACQSYFSDLWNQIKQFNAENNNKATVTQELLDKELFLVNKSSANRTTSTSNINKTKQGAVLNKVSSSDLFEGALENQVRYSASGEVGGWLKFGADAQHRHNPETSYLDRMNSHIIDKTFFPTQPVGIKEGDRVFLALVSYDKDNVATPIIVGRAYTSGFKGGRKVDLSFPGWLDWMSDYPYYINLIDAEVLDGPAKNGISLLDVYRQLKGDIYPSTFGTSVSFEKIRQYHYQKDKIRITSYAAEFLNKELSNRFQKHGVKHIG